MKLYKRNPTRELHLTSGVKRKSSRTSYLSKPILPQRRIIRNGGGGRQ